jgi:hypothetical protein
MIGESAFQDFAATLCDEPQARRNFALNYDVLCKFRELGVVVDLLYRSGRLDRIQMSITGKQ